MSVFTRFVSLASIARHAKAAAIRFPFTLASAVVGVATAMYLIQTEPVEMPGIPMKLILVCVLGLPLFTALSTYAERLGNTTIAKYGIPALGIVPLAFYFFSLPDTFIHTGQYMVRTLLLAIGLHYLAAFIPYLRKGETAAFWRFNKSLFVRFLESALYSGVLFAGLAIAIAAINHLFDAGISEKVYGHLWVFMAGVFQTWVFVAGIPTREDVLNDSRAYPGFLKVFAQYILLTLGFVYFMILIAYEFKIVLTWNWPKGWVSQLVLWYSVVGILSLLLLYPLRDDPDQRWIRVFDRWFFRGLVPLIFMLFFAIYIRIADYGITVSRYLVLAMAVGLTVITLYFLLSRSRDIRAIPIGICVLAFLASFGPWGAFSVSEHSQRNRLEGYLTEYGILTDGTFHDPPAEPPDSVLGEMSSVVGYLCEWHGPEAFRQWFADSVIADWNAALGNRGWRSEVAERMHFRFVSFRPRRSIAGNWFSFEIAPEVSTVVATEGYDYVVAYDAFTPFGEKRLNLIGPDSCWVHLDTATSSLVVHYQYTAAAGLDLVTIPLAGALEHVEAGEHVADSLPPDAVIDATGQYFDFRVVVRRCSGVKRVDGLELQNLRVWLLLRRK